MQRHPSWNKPKEPEVSGQGRLRKFWDAENNLTRLELIDKGPEAAERWLVKFQGKLVHFSVDFESAEALYDKLEAEHF